jgi:hypothetical protein
LEGACFILLFDIIRDPDRPGCEWNFQAVDTGLKCFHHLPPDKLLDISINGVEQIRRSTRRLANLKTGNSTSPASSATELSSEAQDALRPNSPLNLYDPIANSLYNQDTFDGYRGPELDFHYDDAYWADQPHPSLSITPQETDFLDTEFFDLGFYLWSETPGMDFNL